MIFGDDIMFDLIFVVNQQENLKQHFKVKDLLAQHYADMIFLWTELIDFATKNI